MEFFTQIQLRKYAKELILVIFLINFISVLIFPDTGRVQSNT